MRTILSCLLLSNSSLFAASLTADEIMQRVAANQDSAQALRSSYVYQQYIRIRSLDTKHNVRHEETTTYTVLPGPDKTRKELISVEGRHLRKGKYVTYQGREPDQEQDFSGIDTEIVHEMRDELTNDEKSRDGINRDLFPLTTEQQRKYVFELKGEESHRGVRAYRVAFRPKQKTGHEIDIDSSAGPWKGEALIEAEKFQPIEIFTKLAEEIPLAVKVLLGTNLHGLGFNVEYQEIEGGAWFPITYGSEFSIRVLFGWARTVTIALRNSDFRKADVDSTVKFAEIH